MTYQIKGKVEVYNGGNDICDEAGHIACCENAEIAEALASILNARTRLLALHRDDRQAERPSSTSKFDAMTPAQQQHCCFMGYDPDNPDVPLD